jgi:hypothetical protein
MTAPLPPAPASPYPESSQATTILVLGILSLVCCSPLGIVALVMGNNELRAIDEGRRPPENRGTANAGRICGIIAIVLLGLGIILLATGLFTIPFMSDFSVG